MLVAFYSIVIGLLCVSFASAQTTFGTSQKQVWIPPATEYTLYDYSGSGVLTSMWFGGSWTDWDQTLINIYVDGESSPSISFELYLGHGIGFGDQTAPWGTARIGLTSTPSGIYNTYRVPFGSQIVVTVQMPSSVTSNQAFWWIIRGETNYPITFNGYTLPSTARLQLQKQNNILVQPLDLFTMAQISGKTGMLYQVTMAANSSSFSFLEGQFRAYIDGATTPLYLSSGTEDYFLGSYYFNDGIYHLPVAGCTHYVDNEAFSGYRFHEEDPVFFSNALTLQGRCGEEADDYVFGPSPPDVTTFTTYVWVYTW